MGCTVCVWQVGTVLGVDLPVTSSLLLTVAGIAVRSTGMTGS